MKMDARVTYEGFWRRMLAGLLDVALVLVLAVTVLLLAFAVADDPPHISTLIADRGALWIQTAWWLAVMALAQILFVAFLGATPGMLLLGCQVLGADSGRKLSLARSSLRCVGLWMGLACLGIGVLWCIRDPRHQGLHDKLAGSVVVREDESLMALEELAEGVK